MDTQTQKPFSAKRWTENPVFRIVEDEPVRHFTDEEKKENALILEELMRASGQLKPNEHVRNGKIYTE